MAFIAGVFVFGFGCVLEEYDPPSNEAEITFQISGTDVAGNPVDTSQLYGSNTLKVDIQKPTYKNVSIIGDGPIIEEGEQVIVSVVVEDDWGFSENGRFMKGAFNFAPEGIDEYVEAAGCAPIMPEVNDSTEEEQDPWEGVEDSDTSGAGQGGTVPKDLEWECQWLIQGVINKGPVPMVARFKIGDMVGNEMTPPPGNVDEFAYSYVDTFTGKVYSFPPAELEVMGYDPTIIGFWGVDLGIGYPSAEIEGVGEVRVIDNQLIKVTSHVSYIPLTIIPKDVGVNVEAAAVKDIVFAPPSVNDA